VAVTDGVFVLGGFTVGKDSDSPSTVSFYSMTSDTWIGDYPQLNTSRQEASACALKEKVYVFCGNAGSYKPINSIERISLSELV